MAILNVAGEAFNVLVEGDRGKPALMISNPLGTNLHLWDRQMPAFLEHFRVVRYDSRGHGASVVTDGPYSIERLGRDALGILDVLEIDRAHWLGMSLGGVVGLWVLAHAPERLDRAVLANAAAHLPSPDSWNSRIATVREVGMATFAETVAERWFTDSFREGEPDVVESIVAMVRATPEQGYVAACSALRDVDLRERARSIDKPVLVIVGRHDVSIPPDTGAALASAIGGAELVTLDTAHISNLGDPENFTRAVVDFLTHAHVGAMALPSRRRPGARRLQPRKASPVTARAARAPVQKTAAGKSAAAKKGPAKAALSKKPPAGAAVARTPVKKTVSGKATTKKAVTKAIAAKGPTAKVAPKKTAVEKKPVITKAAAKKTAAKKVTPQKQAAAKKVVAAKIPAKTAAAVKAPVKKATQKSATKKSASKSSATKKGAPRKKS